MYPHRWLYYVCIGIDLVLRFTWVLSLVSTYVNSFSVFTTIHQDNTGFFLGALEILRRAMWGHFRMEVEHLKYCRQRSVGFQLEEGSGNRTKALHLRTPRLSKKSPRVTGSAGSGSASSSSQNPLLEQAADAAVLGLDDAPLRSEVQYCPPASFEEDSHLDESKGADIAV